MYRLLSMGGLFLAAFYLGLIAGVGWFTYEAETSVSGYLEQHGCPAQVEVKE